jgi:pimeloyl-ACP methyl ester carboxylesterase
VCLPAGVVHVDPDPGETARREVELLDGWKDGATAVIGWSSGGWRALELAAEHADAVERLVLVATPRPDDDVDWLDGVQAKTLLLYGDADLATGSSHARWWQRRLATARVEMSPGGGHDLLAPLWPRVLSFVAPRAGRRG